MILLKQEPLIEVTIFVSEWLIMINILETTISNKTTILEFK
jgi:hypothetical protein